MFLLDIILKLIHMEFSGTRYHNRAPASQNKPTEKKTAESEHTLLTKL